MGSASGATQRLLHWLIPFCGGTYGHLSLDNQLSLCYSSFRKELLCERNSSHCSSCYSCLLHVVLCLVAARALSGRASVNQPSRQGQRLVRALLLRWK